MTNCAPLPSTKRWTYDAIAQTIAGALHVPASILGKARVGKEFAGARDVYVYSLRTFCDFQVIDIANHLGVDRGTVGDICAAVERRLDADEHLEAFIDRIGQRLTMQARLCQRIEDDRAELARLFPHGPTAVQIAFRHKVSIAEAAPLMSQICDLVRTAAWRGGEAAPSKNHKLSRHGAKKPTGGVDLKVSHPALTEGRTIFPSTVVSIAETERLLVSGHNNPKLGAEVQKGPWKGFPIYHLTLEERATCPRSCALWAGCYGNAMHMARRHDHRHEDFLITLEMELIAIAGNHPFGFAVRLHTLGDFFSLAYVQFWSRMLDDIPALHVFGFTANLAVSGNESESAIGHAIEDMNVAHGRRCFIRFSGEPGQGGSQVFNTAVDDPGIVMCPAQTGATQACATCALCWNENAWSKCIGFLRHGIKKRRQRQPRILRDPSPPTHLPAAHEATQQSPAPIPPEQDRGVVRLKRKPKKLNISPAEQDRLIREALGQKQITVCPPAFKKQ